MMKVIGTVRGSMSRVRESEHRGYLGLRCAVAPLREAGLFLLLGVAMLAAPGAVSAAAMEILTPPPGSMILARKAEIHLVLRRAAVAGASLPWVEAGRTLLEPVVSEEGDGQEYLHFRVPLKPGPNVFTIVPGGPRLEFRYQPVHARVPPNLESFYRFHKDERLPEDCNGCHEFRTTSPLGPLGIAGDASCRGCHQNLAEKAAWRHTTQDTDLCLVCHQLSQEPWRIGLRPGRVEDTCLACHTSKKRWGARKHIHGPLTLGGCTLCHNPHGGTYRYHLWAEGAFDLCVACHSDKAALLAKERRVPFVHGIIGGGGCVICHDPHASDHRFMLIEPTNQLCVGCHLAFAGMTAGHPVDRHPVSRPNELRRPGRELTCAGCHDPHGSQHRHLLFETTVGGRFCRECHKR